MNRTTQSKSFCKRFLELHAPQAITVLATLAYLFMAFATVKCEAGSEGGPVIPPTLLGAPGPLDTQLAGALNQAGVTPIAVPTQESDAMIALGKSLFFDKILSGDQDIACSTCHLPTLGSGDQLPTSIGAGGSGSGFARAVSGGQMIARNAPPLFNLGVNEMNIMFWDGRVSRDDASGVLTTPESTLNGASPARSDITAQLTSALAAQAMFPVTSNEEMRGQPGNDIRDAANNQAAWAAIMARLVGTGNGSSGGLAAYRTLFSAAFPTLTNYDDLNFGHAARAIAAYERQAFLSVGSPFDRYLAGDLLALSDSEKRGALTFFGGAGGCSGCHNGPLLTDNQFHGIAAPQLGPGASGGDDPGRQLISGNGGDRYEFRTPPLRNVALTAPYTHAGAYTSLEAVVAHYANTATGIQNYDGSQLGRSDYIATVDTNATRIQARIDARDRRVARPRRLSAGQRAELTAFLRSLSDPAFLGDLSGEIPASVPSGLPVAD
ncbi:MAG: cytochrome-c peroxidase [bacterium]|nr:cytochrome-c peroxidase [bacterium]